MRSDPTFWVMARAGGLTAYALLTCTVLLGLVFRSRPFGNRPKATTMLDVHRFAALLALSAIAAHGVGLVYDSSVHIDVLGLLVPGRVAYRPLWTGAGVVAAELMLAIVFSFSVRKYIGVRNWRRLHWLTYGLFVAATAHGLFSGTDSRKLWVQALYLGAIGAVTLAVTWRALTAGRPKRTTLGPLTAPPEPSAAR